MYMKVNIGALRNDLSKYLNEVRAGNEVIITDHNEPIAKIVTLAQKIVKSDLSNWLKNHPPVKPKKKQSAAWKLMREIRDEE